MDTTFIRFLAVCSFLHQGLSLSCYECNSQDDPSCLEHPPESAKKECTQENPLCRILHLEVKIPDSPSHKRVIRNCGSAEPNDVAKPCYRITDYGPYQKVCSCKEDGCNSSSQLVATTILFVGIATIFILLY